MDIFIGGISSRAGKSSLILSSYSLTLRKFHAELYYLLEKSPYKFIDSIRPYSRLHKAYSRSRRYKYKWGCAYSFCQNFQGLRLFQTLEYFYFESGKKCELDIEWGWGFHDVNLKIYGDIAIPRFFYYMWISLHEFWWHTWKIC